jgi:hypothetical protein
MFEALRLLFFSSKKSKKVMDEMLGELIYSKIKVPSWNMGFCEGQYYFKPANKKVNISLGSVEEEDLSKRKEFLKIIENNYNNILRDIEIFWNKNKTNIGLQCDLNLKDNYTLRSIYISDSVNDKESWSLTFASVNDEKIEFGVGFEQYAVESVSLDVSTKGQ